MPLRGTEDVKRAVPSYITTVPARESFIKNLEWCGGHFRRLNPKGLVLRSKTSNTLNPGAEFQIFRGLLSVIILVLRRSERGDLATVREPLNGSGECL